MARKKTSKKSAPKTGRKKKELLDLLRKKLGEEGDLKRLQSLSGDLTEGDVARLLDFHDGTRDSEERARVLCTIGSMNSSEFSDFLKKRACDLFYKSAYAFRHFGRLSELYQPPTMDDVSGMVAEALDMSEPSLRISVKDIAVIASMSGGVPRDLLDAVIVACYQEYDFDAIAHLAESHPGMTASDIERAIERILAAASGYLFGEYDPLGVGRRFYEAQKQIPALILALAKKREGLGAKYMDNVVDRMAVMTRRFDPVRQRIVPGSQADVISVAKMGASLKMLEKVLRYCLEGVHITSATEVLHLLGRRLGERELQQMIDALEPGPRISSADLLDPCSDEPRGTLLD